MEVTLVIPNYNGLDGLKNLIPQVLKEDFNKIYVLDDLSTDGSIDFLKTISDPRLNVVEGKTNVGPGATRNRILNQDCGELIMFLDADIELQSTNFVSEIAQKFTENKDIGILGGLILTQEGKPMWWNYGSEMHPVRDAKINTILDTALKFYEDESLLSYFSKILRPISLNLEISLKKPHEREVDWVAEANICVNTKIFRELKGFDEKMRYHETQDFCKRLRKLNKKVLFSPIVKVRHLEIEVRERREKDIREAAKYFYKKHWDMSEKTFDKLFPVKNQNH